MHNVSDSDYPFGMRWCFPRRRTFYANRARDSI